MHCGHPLRTAIAIQAAFAALFLVVALAGRERIERELFDGSAALYWVLVVGVIAYAASYFARGWLAGHSRFGLYGGLVLLESVSRCLFALAVVIGIASGQSAVALGIAAAPLVSLMVVPWALRGRDAAPPARRRERGDAAREHRLRGRRAGDHGRRAGAAQRPGGGHRRDRADAALAGFVFNVLLITRAPLQLFQADPDLAAPPPLGPGRHRGRRGLHARPAGHAAGDRRLRRRRRARPRRRRPDGDAPAVRRRLRLRARRAGAGRHRHGLPPRRGDAQPGRAGPRPRGPRRRRLAGLRGAVPRLARARAARRPAARRRGRLLRDDRGAGPRAVADRALGSAARA